MASKIEYKKGDVIGSCVFIKDIDKNIPRRTALFECECGGVFISRVDAVKCYDRQYCGCRDGQFKQSHGKSYDEFYGTWARILNRCYNTKDIGYKNYGAKGIRIAEMWKDLPLGFIEYVSNLENAGRGGYSIDRINGKGSYEPGNLKWSTRHEQSANRFYDCKYVGVARRKKTGRYRVWITINKKRCEIGNYATANEGVEARNLYIIKNGLSEYPLH